MKRIGLACAVLGLMVMAAGRSQADVIYDNLIADTYTSGVGVGITSGGSYTETFVAAASGIEADIKVAMVSVPTSGATSDFTLTLKDSFTNVLDVLHGTAPSLFAPPLSVVEVFSTLHPLLTAGQTYTLTASAGSATTVDQWAFGDSIHLSTAGFRVETAPIAIPEPSTFVGAATAVGFGLSCACRRRKRSAA